MDQSIVRSLFGSQSMSLGDAVQVAKSSIADLDVRRTFILFGDPLMQIKRPSVASQQVLPRPNSGIPAQSRPMVSPSKSNSPHSQQLR
jgi:hypothetical protein